MKADPPQPFRPEELARMTPSARRLCEMIGKNSPQHSLSIEEIELLRRSKQEVAQRFPENFARHQAMR